MKREEKEQFVAQLHERLEKAEATFMVAYKGLNVEAMNTLRNELRNVKAEFQVVKNRLLKRASQKTGTHQLVEHMTGPSAITLTYDDVVAPAKVLVDFQKEHKDLEIKGAQISGKPMGSDQVQHLAALPGREVLLAKTLSVMHGVPTAFVRVLSGVTVNLMNVLKAIEEQKA